MPLNTLARIENPQNDHACREVQRLFLDYCNNKENNKDLFYKEDVYEVEQMTFLLQRCVIVKKGDVNDSLRLLVDMLKWRREQRLRELSDKDIPIEYRQAGAIFQYEPDKFGNRTMYIRAKVLRSIPELRSSFKEYLTYLIYKTDYSLGGETWSIVFDLSNTGWNNYDIDLLMYLVRVLKEYFPVKLDYVLAVNFPWVLSAVWPIAKRLIPPERRDVVNFINAKDIFNYIDEEKVPDFLGGTCKRDYKRTNDCDSTTVGYLLSLEPQVPAKRIQEILKIFEEILPEDQVNTMYKQFEHSRRK